MKRFGWLLVLLYLSSVVGARNVAAADGQRCFEETGFCIAGTLRAYWEHNGGLAVFGYPLTAEQTQTVEGTWTGPVQWFERDRLEDHSNEGLGVLAGRLGALSLELQGRPWAGLFPSEYGEKPGCSYFIITHFNVCPPFLNYWQQHGGLERFGYPLTPAFEETTSLPDGKVWRGTVQYFERRRMEYHPEYAGTPSAVLLGLLGHDVLRGAPCAMVGLPRLDRVVAQERTALGCPTDVHQGLTMSVQPFEHGWMVWAPNVTEGRSQIFIITRNSVGRLQWQSVFDSYVEGETIVGATPPPGRFAPVRGFGKVYWGRDDIRGALGWGVAPEAADTGSTAFYLHNGAWMIDRSGTEQVTVLYPNGSVLEIR